MKLRNLIFLIFIAFVFSCKKELDHYTISNDFKDWVVFKPGTYWIYKNEITGIVDTTFDNYSPVYGTSNSTEEEGYIYDLIFFYLSDSFISGYQIHAELDCDIAFIDDTLIFSKGAVFRSDMVTGQTYKYFEEKYQQLGYYNNFMLNDSIFQNVIHIRKAAPNWGVNDSIINEYYFSKHIGLIKYEVRQGNKYFAWSLVGWKVIQ